LGDQAGEAAVFGEPLGGVLGVDAQLAGEDLRGCGGRGQPDDGPGPVDGLPHAAKPGHRRRLAGPGRADEHVEAPAGRSDLGDCDGLVRRQPAAGTSCAVGGDDGSDVGADGGGVEGAGGGEESGFGGDERLGAVAVPCGRRQSGGPVRTDEGSRDVQR
jgi:hypothetical protein